MVGQVFAWGFIALGGAQILFGGSLGGIWLILVGWMMIQAARATARQTLLDQQLAGVSAARLMTTPESWLSPYMTLGWAAKDRLRDWDTRCLPVSSEDPDAEYGGLMCARDLRRAARERYDFDRVRDVMTPAPRMPAVTPETEAADVLRLLRERQSDRAVVVDAGGRLLGFIDVDAFARFVNAARPPARRRDPAAYGSLMATTAQSSASTPPAYSLTVSSSVSASACASSGRLARTASCRRSSPNSTPSRRASVMPSV